jgi:hypothetical protein
MSIEERLEELERELALTKAALFQSKTINKEVRANKFVLVDENGNPRAELSVSSEGAWLTLRDEKFTPRVMLCVSDDFSGSCLELSGLNGEPIWSAP